MTASGDHGPLLLHAVKQVELAVRTQLDELLRPLGVTVAQYTAMTVLTRRNGLTSAALARDMLVTPQSMADLVGALERRGVIERVPDPEHTRRVLIRINDAGHALLTRLAGPVQAVEEEMLRDLTPVERARLRDYLARCRVALRR